MFSEAISSISSRWRPSSLPMTSAISGSASASVAEKNASSRAATASVADIQQFLECDGDGGDSITSRERQELVHKALGCRGRNARYILRLRRARNGGAPANAPPPVV